jgi:hypothetical protein
MKTIDDILAFIKDNSTKDDWKLSDGHVIRTAGPRSGHSCPLCWLGTKTNNNQYHDTLLYKDICEKMGIDIESVGRPIAIASDDGVEHCDFNPILRQRLLEACHLVG